MSYTPSSCRVDEVVVEVNSVVVGLLTDLGLDGACCIPLVPATSFSNSSLNHQPIYNQTKRVSKLDSDPIGPENEMG
jgi:hypothetical protein